MFFLYLTQSRYLITSRTCCNLCTEEVYNLYGVVHSDLGVCCQCNTEVHRLEHVCVRLYDASCDGRGQDNLHIARKGHSHCGYRCNSKDYKTWDSGTTVYIFLLFKTNFNIIVHDQFIYLTIV